MNPAAGGPEQEGVSRRPTVGFGFSDVDPNGQTVGGERAESLHQARGPSNVPDCNVGLGTGPGGLLARSYLASSGHAVLELSTPRMSQHQRLGGGLGVHPGLTPRRDSSAGLDPGGRGGADAGAKLPLPPSLSDREPPGLFLGLLTNDNGPVPEQDVQAVAKHRWAFKGAADVARKSRGHFFFVWCLLDLQRNVQMEEEGDALDRKLARACRSFVGAQCRDGHAGDMYQLLTHFISNSMVFYEWDKFLRVAFEDARAAQESFLAPHLEQVWGRFSRLRATLEGVFGTLDGRFAWKHRLPKVGELVQEHMRRRCFSSEAATRNELFAQANLRNETLKQVKFAFGIN